jgi:hypothetical protein
MKKWLQSYPGRVLRKADHGPLDGGPEKLELLWPMMLGGAVFASLDVGFEPEDPLRTVLLGLLVGPGMAWAAFVIFRWVMSFPRRYRGHKDQLKDEAGQR